MSPHARPLPQRRRAAPGCDGVTTSGLCALGARALGDDLVPAERQVRRQRERGAPDQPAVDRPRLDGHVGLRDLAPTAADLGVQLDPHLDGVLVRDVHRHVRLPTLAGRRARAAARGATACPRRGRSPGRRAPGRTRRRRAPRARPAGWRPTRGGSARGSPSGRGPPRRPPRGAGGRRTRSPGRLPHADPARASRAHAGRTLPIASLARPRSRAVVALRTMTAPALRTYPTAPRTDLVEDLHGHRVADPFRGLEDADVRRDRGVVGRAGRPVRAVPRRRSAPTGPFATDVLTDRLRALLGAGFVSPPAWRGERRFFSRRLGDQEHACRRGRPTATTSASCSTRSRSTPPARRRSTRGSRPRRATCVAYQVSVRRHRGERPARARRRHRRARRRADRPGALLPRGVAARRRGVLLRAPAAPGAAAGGRGAVPPPRLAAPPRHPGRRTTSRCSARASTTPTTTASRSPATGAG